MLHVYLEVTDLQKATICIYVAQFEICLYCQLCLVCFLSNTANLWPSNINRYVYTAQSELVMNERLGVCCGIRNVNC